MDKLPTFITSADPGLIIPLALISVPVIYGTTLLVRHLLTPASKPNTYDPATGIGRGAPGFQTGSQRVALPVEIVARIRMGEEVTAEEITEALRVEKLKREEEERKEAERLERERNGGKRLPPGVDSSWLPEGALKQANAGRGTQRRKK